MVSAAKAPGKLAGRINHGVDRPSQTPLKIPKHRGNSRQLDGANDQQINIACRPFGRGRYRPVDEGDPDVGLQRLQRSPQRVGHRRRLEKNLRKLAKDWASGIGLKVDPSPVFSALQNTGFGQRP